MSQNHKGTKTVIHAFEALATDSHLRAVALSGPWGTGKTYLVREFIRIHADKLESANLKFAYISLFGVQSLSEVRARLAAATIESEKENLLKTLGKKIVMRGLIPGKASGLDLSKVGDIAKEYLENRLLMNLFVCIDDLERVGPNLRPIDVLGFISELTEQRSCKVLLVMNREKLEDCSAVQLFEEKVFDLTLDYQPSPSDVMNHAIVNKQEREAALPIFDGFKSANIRVMKRLAWVLHTIGKVAVEDRDLIWPQVVRHASILCLLKFEHGLTRVNFQDVLERSESVLFVRQMRKSDKDYKPPCDTFTELLDELGHETHSYDAAIVDLLHDGYFDSASMSEAFNSAIQEHRSRTCKQQAEDFTRMLRGGLKHTAPEMAKQLKDYLSGDISALHPSNIAVLSDLLVSIDTSQTAIELVAELMTPIWTSCPQDMRESQLKEFPALWRSGIIQGIPYLAVHHEHTLREAFDEIAVLLDGWNDEKIVRLVQASDIELRTLFLSLDATDSMFQIRRLRERLKHDGSLSKEDREGLSMRIDSILADLSAEDPLYKYQLHLFARPRP